MTDTTVKSEEKKVELVMVPADSDDSKHSLEEEKEALRLEALALLFSGDGDPEEKKDEELLPLKQQVIADLRRIIFGELKLEPQNDAYLNFRSELRLLGSQLYNEQKTARGAKHELIAHQLEHISILLQSGPKSWNNHGKNLLGKLYNALITTHLPNSVASTDVSLDSLYSSLVAYNSKYQNSKGRSRAVKILAKRDQEAIGHEITPDTLEQLRKMMLVTVEGIEQTSASKKSEALQEFAAILKEATAVLKKQIPFNPEGLISRLHKLLTSLGRKPSVSDSDDVTEEEKSVANSRSITKHDQDSKVLAVTT